MSISSVSLLAPSSIAPDFTLPSTIANPVSLADLNGRPVILVFYPGDFTPVCSDQLTLYNELVSLFEGFDAQLLAISVDNLKSHMAFSADRRLEFPLLADSNPLGDVARRYGVFDEESQTCERALFVIDRTGRVSWSYLSRRDVNPGAAGILRALESLPA